jgi:hypothetical protein
MLMLADPKVPSLRALNDGISGKQQARGDSKFEKALDGWSLVCCWKPGDCENPAVYVKRRIYVG